MTANLRRLGDVVELNPRPPAWVRKDDEVTFVPMPAVDARSGTIHEFNTRQAQDVWNQPSFVDGDVLFAKITPSLQNGKHAVARNLRNGVGFGSTEFHVLRPSPVVLSDWVHQYLRRPEVAELAERRLVGSAGQQRVPSSFLSELLIHVPDLPTQRRVLDSLGRETAILNRARDAAATGWSASRGIAARIRERAFALADKESDRQLLGALAEVQSGYAFRSEWFRPTGIRLLRNANVGHRHIDWTDQVRLDDSMRSAFGRFELFEGDIILSLDRPIVASGLKVTRLGPTDVPSLLLQRVARITPGPKVEAEYLFEFMLSDEFRSSIATHDQSLGVPHVSPEQVRRIEIPLLPIREQRRITRALRVETELADTLEAKTRQQVESLDMLPAALLRRAFGEMPA